MARNLFPKMVTVSRDCGFTRQLHTILTAKLDNNELEVLQRWLQIVEEETQTTNKRHF